MEKLEATVVANKAEIGLLCTSLTEVCRYYGEEEYSKQTHELVFTSIADFIQDVQAAKVQVAIRQAEAKQRKLLEERRNSGIGGPKNVTAKVSPKHSRSRSLLGAEGGKGDHQYGLVDNIMERLRREIVEAGKSKQLGNQ